MNTKQRLQLNPKYDFEWVNIAAWFIDNNIATENFLSNFNSDSLNKIKSIVNTPYFQIVFDPRFNNTQLEIIIACINKGFNKDIIVALANPDIPYKSMDYIAQGFEEGLNWTEINNFVELTPEQCYEILYGFRIGIDYKSYAATIVPAVFMHMIASALNEGLDAKYNIDTKELLVRPKEILQKNNQE